MHRGRARSSWYSRVAAAYRPLVIGAVSCSSAGLRVEDRSWKIPELRVEALFILTGKNVVSRLVLGRGGLALEPTGASRGVAKPWRPRASMNTD